MLATVYHGESDTIYYLVDENAPEDEQPAVVGSVSTREPEYEKMTLNEIEREQKAV